jgi:transcription elongation factor Elf1
MKRFRCLRCGKILQRYAKWFMGAKTVYVYHCPDCHRNYVVEEHQVMPEIVSLDDLPSPEEEDD